jgi:putative Mg2+ transporter-C (MgtC) family protein
MLPSQRSARQTTVNLPVHFSTTEQMAFLQGTTTRLLMACGLGAVVGLERESRHKASGLRTSMLICMGAALFTVMSGVLAGDASPNRGQVASNIVQGIGFLGAGLILHSANRVLGLTSAATVWVVAAIGMTCGAGLYVPAAIATLIVFVALRFVGLIESRSRWKRYAMLYEVRGADEKAMFAGVLCALDKWKMRLNIVERQQIGTQEQVTFSVSASSARHKQVLAELRACEATDHVACFRDEEED